LTDGIFAAIILPSGIQLNNLGVLELQKNIRFRVVIVSLCIGLVLSAAGGFLYPQQVWAQGGDYGLQPVSLETGKPLGRLAYSCQPGETIHDGVNVISYSNSQVELVAFGTMATTAGRGGVSLPEEPTPGSWISLSTSRLSIPPNETSQFEYTINIPPDAKPGEHVMGIIVQAVEATKGEVIEGVQIGILVRRALTVNIFIPGPIEIGLEIPSLEQVWGGPYIGFDIALENTGNVLVKTEGGLDVADDSGKVIGSFPVKTGAILPGDTLIYHIDCHDLLPPGQYSASVNINYTAVKPVAATELTDEEITELATERSVTATIVFEVTEETVEEVVKKAEEEGFELEPWTREAPTAPFNLLLIISITAGVLVVAMAILLVVLLRRRRR